MSMYLPNPDLRPTGFEPAEFIDPSTTVPEPRPTDQEDDPSRSPAGSPDPPTHEE
jgi:hypothetical protein